MTIQHSAIPEAQLHQPKGASTATVNETIHSDGAGGTTWEKVSPPHLSGITTNGLVGQHIVVDGAGNFGIAHHPGSVHGEIYLAAASVSVGPTGGTITADADYRVVGPTWTANPDAYNIQLHSSNQAIQALVAGHYIFSAYISFATGAVPAGTDYSLKFRVNGSATLSTRRLVTEKVTAGSDRLTISGSALLDLSANNYVDLMIASSTADTITVSDAGIMLVYLHAF